MTSSQFSADDWGDEARRVTSRRQRQTRLGEPRHTRPVIGMQREDARDSMNSTEWGDPDVEVPVQKADLDEQLPETLYYLARVIKIPSVQQVYVEQTNTGATKHWAVLPDVDYEARDRIYHIEYDMHQRFPEVKLKFRVTRNPDGPREADGVKLLFDRG